MRAEAEFKLIVPATTKTTDPAVSKSSNDSVESTTVTGRLFAIDEGCDPTISLQQLISVGIDEQ